MLGLSPSAASLPMTAKSKALLSEKMCYGMSVVMRRQAAAGSSTRWNSRKAGPIRTAACGAGADAQLASAHACAHCDDRPIRRGAVPVTPQLRSLLMMFAGGSGRRQLDRSKTSLRKSDF
jgi:hypothetical protein